MKNFIIFTLLLIFDVCYSQTEIKTVDRPDGVTLKYFNPSPVAIASSHEAGLSLYKNINTKQYFITITVLFKQQTPTELSGNLLIQTTGTKGLSLTPVYHKLINMNGKNVAASKKCANMTCFPLNEQKFSI